MSNRKFPYFVSVMFSMGIAIGFTLTYLTKPEPYKLLNLAGLSYDLLGVIVLSEIPSSSETWKRISVTSIAPGILWAHMLLPFGAIVGAALSSLLLSRPSVAVVKFAFAFWCYSLIPNAFLDCAVVFPPFVALRKMERRWRWFGLYLLLSGVGLQLIAAALSLTQS